MIGVQQVALQYSWGRILFHGVRENKPLFLSQVQKQNTKVLLMLLQR